MSATPNTSKVKTAIATATIIGGLVLLFWFLFLKPVEIGRGAGVEACGDLGTTIVANYEDPSGLTSPASLINHNTDTASGTDIVYETTMQSGLPGDIIDQLGEAVCTNPNGATVLTVFGDQIRLDMTESTQ